MTASNPFDGCPEWMGPYKALVEDASEYARSDRWPEDETRLYAPVCGVCGKYNHVHRNNCPAVSGDTAERRFGFMGSKS